jgi:hypothetical protein
MVSLQKVIKGLEIGDVAGKAYGSKRGRYEGVVFAWRKSVIECGS